MKSVGVFSIFLMGFMWVLKEAFPFPISENGENGKCSKLIAKCSMLFPRWNRQREECLADCLFEGEYEDYEEPGDERWTMIEGDILIDETKLNFFYQLSRKFRMPLDNTWPNGTIPFVIDQSSLPDKDVIIEAIKEWTENTCIVFNEVPEDSKIFRINFIKSKGCFSLIGREFNSSENGQILSVGSGCNTKGIIIHELGHAIGLLHEHTRRDRDGYIKILFENIQEERQQNFLFKYNSDNFDVPYDTRSIMHYNSKTFTKNGKNTVVTLDPMEQLLIGQRIKLSFYDIKIINIVYNCSSHCDASIECKNGGFVDKYCDCRCPPGFSGDSCETKTEDPSPLCGGMLNQTTTITSPNYPDICPIDSKCIWWIKAPKNQRISLSFDFFNIYPRDEHNIACRFENIEIRSKDNYIGEFFCGEELNGETITSLRNEMIVLFSSYYYETKGFNATFNFIQKKQEIHSEDQVQD